jgi:hypothetical protein
LVLPLFAFTLFVSAFLLFLVQPIIGKMILPRLGGTPQVWNTCMVFFQAALLAGYAYTHTVSTRFNLRRQLLVHCIVLLVPLAILLPPLGPFSIAGFEPPPGANPIPYTLFFLTLVVGLPFFVVSTSAPLLQRWFAYTGHHAGKDPYFLYGASNLGSMLALLCYPFLVEPIFLLRSQASIWAVGYVLLGLFVYACAAMVWKSPEAEKPLTEPEVPPSEMPLPPAETSTAFKAGAPMGGAARKKKGKVQRPHAKPAALKPAAETARLDDITPMRRLRWVLLAAAPSSLMLGAITYISTDLSPIPLFWVLPLALYLLTFILVFNRYPVAWTGRPHSFILFAHLLAVFLLCYIMVGAIPVSPITRSTVITLACFFVTAMVCHGELARDRPSAKHLTEFYLWMSVGGMLGGVFNGLVAPVLFTGVAEYPLALFAACLLRPQQRNEGWSDELVTSTFPGISEWFENFGQSFRQVPKLLFGVGLIIVTGAVMLGTYAFGHQENEGVTFCIMGLELSVALCVFGLRYHPRYSFSYLLDGIYPLIIFSIGSYLLFHGLHEWGWLRLDKDTFLERLRKFLGKSRGVQGEGILWMFNSIIYGLPLVISALYYGRPLRYGLTIGAVLLFHQLYGRERGERVDTLYAGRSYFGVLRVYQDDHRLSQAEIEQFQKMENGKEISTAAPYRYLMHGTTHHGLNYQAPKSLRRLATTYYHQKGPVGIIMEKLNWFHDDQNHYDSDARLPASFTALGAATMGASPLPMAQIVGAWSEPPYATVGLGTGTMASYGRPFQHVTFYEIDDTIRSFHLGNPFYFNYLQDAMKRGSNVEVIMGDARRSLMEEKPQPGHAMTPKRDNYYRVIELDAFSSDAIPVHLITEEAIKLYFQKLCEQGVLMVHTSNRHVDLVKPVTDTAAALGLAYRVGHDGGQTGSGRDPYTEVELGPSGYRGHFSSEYVMIARKSEYLPKEEQVTSPLTGQVHLVWATPPPPGDAVWTDDYSNLVGVLRESTVLYILVLLLLGIGVSVVIILVVCKNLEEA